MVKESRDLQCFPSNWISSREIDWSFRIMGKNYPPNPVFLKYDEFIVLVLVVLVLLVETWGSGVTGRPNSSLRACLRLPGAGRKLLTRRLSGPSLSGKFIDAKPRVHRSSWPQWCPPPLWYTRATTTNFRQRLVHRDATETNGEAFFSLCLGKKVQLSIQVFM